MNPNFASSDVALLHDASSFRRSVRVERARFCSGREDEDGHEQVRSNDKCCVELCCVELGLCIAGWEAG